MVVADPTGGIPEGEEGRSDVLKRPVRHVGGLAEDHHEEARDEKRRIRALLRILRRKMHDLLLAWGRVEMWRDVRYVRSCTLRRSGVMIGTDLWDDSLLIYRSPDR